jgi:membrane-bound lytic murein transglycosylase B
VEAAVIRAAAGTPGISPSEAKQLPTYTAAHEVAERANKLTPNLDPEDTMKGCVRVELDDQGKPAKVVVTKVSTTDTPNNG